MAGRTQLEKVTELEASGWKVLPPLDPGMMGAPVPMLAPDGRRFAVHEDGSIQELLSPIQGDDSMLTADIKAKLKSHGVSDDHIAGLERLPAAVKKAVNWTALAALLAKAAAGGGVTVADVLAIFTPATA